MERIGNEWVFFYATTHQDYMNIMMKVLSPCSACFITRQLQIIWGYKAIFPSTGVALYNPLKEKAKAAIFFISWPTWLAWFPGQWSALRAVIFQSARFHDRTLGKWVGKSLNLFDFILPRPKKKYWFITKRSKLLSKTLKVLE